MWCCILYLVCVRLLCVTSAPAFTSHQTTDLKHLQEQTILQDSRHVYHIVVEEVDKFGNSTVTEIDVVDDESEELRRDLERTVEQERGFRDERRTVRRPKCEKKRGKARNKCWRRLRRKLREWKRVLESSDQVLRIRSDKTIVLPDVLR